MREAERGVMKGLGRWEGARGSGRGRWKARKKKRRKEKRRKEKRKNGETWELNEEELWEWKVLEKKRNSILKENVKERKTIKREGIENTTLMELNIQKKKKRKGEKTEERQGGWRYGYQGRSSKEVEGGDDWR